MTTSEAEVLRMGREAQHFRLGTALADRPGQGASGVEWGKNEVTEHELLTGINRMGSAARTEGRLPATNLRFKAYLAKSIYSPPSYNSCHSRSI